jgi:serine/threonine protein kinase
MHIKKYPEVLQKGVHGPVLVDHGRDVPRRKVPSVFKSPETLLLPDNEIYFSAMTPAGFRQTRTIPPPGDALAPQLSPKLIESYLRSRGVHESILVHSQNYKEFLRAQGVTELGRGGEGAVYFLRGHVVKLAGPDFAPSLLREIVHMLHLNPIVGDSTMGDRSRADLPGLLWVYSLSDGSLSVGMKPFDSSDAGPRGSTLYDRLTRGPEMEREHVLQALRSICATLVYIHKKGIIHHDLKPANTYIPGDPSQDPVVFDLGQALWKQNAWGANWLTHGHNLHYWYNGTYQYMHRLRRKAHMGALNIAAGRALAAEQRDTFLKFAPCPYDDIFSFAYMVRDVVGSKFMKLLEIDRKLLSDYYRSLMGLVRAKTAAPAAPHKTSILARVKTMFGKDHSAEALPVKKAEAIETMEQAYAKFDPLVKNLLGIK